MGNYRFRLSDMIPNAWFYKLKDMGSSRTKTSHSNSKQSIIKKKHHFSTPPQNQPKQSQISHHRHSYYISSEPFKPDRLYDSPNNSKGLDVHFPDPPRKSSRRRSKRRTITTSSKLVTSSVSSGCSCRASLNSDSAKPDATTEYSASASPLHSSPDPEFHGSLVPEFGSERTELFEGLASWSNSCSCRVSSSATDIIIDMNSKKCSASAGKFDKVDMFDSIPELELPPILTKPAKFNDMIADIKNRDAKAPRFRRNSGKSDERKVNVNGLSVKVVKEESVKTVKEQRTGLPIRRSSPISPGLKLRANSPRIASKKIQAYSRKTLSASANSKLRRKNLSESFAVVKSSFDPQRDFRESMVEMILENNIRASKDLEELLACYLSLNSNEYHDLIIKVFEQIWFDLTDIQL